MATRRRYNAAIQRVKGMLEPASGLYETSLSHRTRGAAEGVLRMDARLGYRLRLSLLPRSSQTPCDVSLHPGAFYRKRGYLA